MKDRTLRKTTHILIGLFIFLVLNTLGKWIAELGLFLILLIGIFIQDQKIKGKKLFIIDTALEKMGDKNEFLPGIGAMQYFVGLLFIISFLNDLYHINASIIMLSFGDGIASMVNGKIKWPYNKHKTLEGSICFLIVSAMGGYLYARILGVIIALIVTVVESLPLKGISDNLTVPISAVILFKLI